MKSYWKTLTSMLAQNNNKTYKNIAISLIIIALVAIASFGIVDKQGQSYVDSGFKRAMIAFAVARGLNGVISVAQGTELSLQPAGVGVNLAPGQILDPLNDLIERFSVVMLFSASSLGIQKMLLTVVSWVGFSVLLVITLLMFLSDKWGKKPFLPPWFSKMMVIFLIARLAVPALSMANEAFYQLFLETSYEESLSGLQQTSDKIEEAGAKEGSATKDISFFGQAKKFLKSTQDSLDLQKRFDGYKQAATEVSYQVVDMIVIFIVQTVLFPLLFLWVVVKFAKNIIKS